MQTTCDIFLISHNQIGTTSRFSLVTSLHLASYQEPRTHKVLNTFSWIRKKNWLHFTEEHGSLSLWLTPVELVTAEQMWTISLIPTSTLLPQHSTPSFYWSCMYVISKKIKYLFIPLFNRIKNVFGTGGVPALADVEFAIGQGHLSLKACFQVYCLQHHQDR